TEQNVGSLDPLKPPFTRRELNLGALSNFLQKPGDVLQAKYGWGAGGFDGRALLQKVEKLALEMNLPAVYTATGTPTLDFMFLELQPKTDIAPPGIVLRLQSPLKANNTFKLESPLWVLEFGNDVKPPVGATLTLKPDGSFAIGSPSTSVQGKI